MSSDLHDWRHTAGFVTLLMACAFTGEWFRSRSVEDVISITVGGDRSIVMMSVQGHIASMFWTRSPGATHIPLVEWEIKRVSDLQGFDHDPMIHWRWKWAGFCVGTIILDTPSRIWSVPYWSIVIPLILLSAYLLLSKPRNTSQSPAAEPSFQKFRTVPLPQGSEIGIENERPRR